MYTYIGVRMCVVRVRVKLCVDIWVYLSVCGIVHAPALYTCVFCWVCTWGRTNGRSIYLDSQAAGTRS